MEELVDVRSPVGQKAPPHVIAKALAESKKILHIVWDEAGGYPEHAWGYEQWSVRPFTPRYGCDGTTDANIHLIAMRLCTALGLDYPMLYEKAYAWREGDCSGDWLRDMNWEKYEKETVVPALSQTALRDLLYDLYEINNRSVVEVLSDTFESMGYDVSEWW